MASAAELHQSLFSWSLRKRYPKRPSYPPITVDIDNTIVPKLDPQESFLLELHYGCRGSLTWKCFRLGVTRETYRARIIHLFEKMLGLIEDL